MKGQLAWNRLQKSIPRNCEQAVEIDKRLIVGFSWFLSSSCLGASAFPTAIGTSGYCACADTLRYSQIDRQIHVFKWHPDILHPGAAG